MEIVIWMSTIQLNDNNFENMHRLPEVGDPTLTRSRIIQIKKQFILWRNYKTGKYNGKLGVYFVTLEKVVGIPPSREKYPTCARK